MVAEDIHGFLTNTLTTHQTRSIMFKLPYALPTYAIHRAAEPPALDGWLESPCWQGAVWVDRFLTVETGAPTGKATSTALAWDDQYLYVAILCAESKLGYLRADATTPEETWGDDAFEVYLDAAIPGVESLDFSINVTGRGCPAQRIITDPGWGTYQFKEAGGLRAAVRYTGSGWQAEVAIPFGENGLPHPAAGDTWRGNVCRNDRLGYTWSFWALSEGTGSSFTYSDRNLLPYLRFCADAIDAPVPAPAPVQWPSTPRFALRGFMYDTSRGSIIYTADYWKSRLPLLQELGYNTLLMYFENHLRYPSHPAFAPSGSWTLTELAGLQEAAAGYGIDIIPAQTSLGHCPGILTHPAYQHLAEEGSDGYQFCPSHPETPGMLADIFSELAQASRSPYVSINADESAFLGMCPRCREAYPGQTKGEIFRTHILRLYEVLKAHGKRMMMWDDMLWTYPEAVDGLPRDIILLDWHYSFHRNYPSVEAWRSMGFDVVACPGMYQVENEFWLADTGAKHGAMGLIDTLWEDHTRPLGANWHHLLATSWAAHAPAPVDMDEWYALAGRHFFGPAGARLGRAIAAHDSARRNGYGKGRSASRAVLEFATREVVEEAECLLPLVPTGMHRELLEEFLYAWKLTLLEMAPDRALLDALQAEGLTRWEQQSPAASQREAFLERFTAVEKRLETAAR
jgi:hypothetical protein